MKQRRAETRGTTETEERRTTSGHTGVSHSCRATWWSYTYTRNYLRG